MDTESVYTKLYCTKPGATTFMGPSLQTKAKANEKNTIYRLCQLFNARSVNFTNRPNVIVL